MLGWEFWFDNIIYRVPHNVYGCDEKGPEVSALMQDKNTSRQSRLIKDETFNSSVVG